MAWVSESQEKQIGTKAPQSSQSFRRIPQSKEQGDGIKDSENKGMKIEVPRKERNLESQ